MHRRLLVLLLFGVLLLASGCAGGREAAPPQEAPAVAPTAALLRESEAGAISDAAELPATERVIIYRADVTIRVADVGTAMDEIEALAGEYGGFVVSADAQRDASGELRGTMTLRVDAEQFDAAIQALEELSVEVLSAHRESEDVTAEYVDLEARLTNLRRVEEELRTLLTEVRENRQSAEEILEVYRELARVREEIERIQGRMQYLESQSQLATITVRLQPETTIVRRGWQPGGVVEDALRALVRGLQLLFSVAVWATVVVLPLLVLALLPFTLLVVVVRRWRRRQQTNSSQAE